MRKIKRNKIRKIILFLLIILTSILIVYFYDKTENNSNEINENNKIDILDKNTEDTNKNDNTIDNKEEIKNNDSNEKKENIIDTPKKNENEENKQEQENNLEYKIELIGEESVIFDKGSKYIEYGVKVFDLNGNDVSKKVKIENNVNTSVEGTYMVIYSIGKAAVIRNVIVR